MKPIVAIIGRPNVGKSTLFNRIVGHRKALTHDQPGVTRDRNFADAHWGGRDFVCIDTGGFPLEQGTLDEKVEEQIALAMSESDCILCVFDGQAGLVPEEARIVEKLRPIGKPVFYVVNKIDVPAHEDRLMDFYAAGVEELLPVSSEHGYQVAELLDRLVASFPSELQDTPLDEATIQLAVVGRPNVGKSSLVNALLGQSRVVVDATPGTTRDPIDTPFHVGEQPYLLVDTAGIRRRSQKGGALERITVMQSLRAIERADICLLVLAADQALSKQDSHIAGTITDRGRGLILVWNKIDLMPTPDRKRVLRSTRDSLKYLPSIPIHLISAREGQGVNSLLPEVKQLHEELATRVPTSRLNEVFSSLVEHHNIPSYRGKEVKIYYATQVGIRPPTFIVFANYPAGVPETYRRYLQQGLREQLGLERIPVRLVVRKRK